MKRLSLFFLCLSILSIHLPAQENPKDKGLKTITENSLQGPLEFLASDWMTGRETGTRGEYMASDYIASMFKTMGLKPGVNSGFLTRSYFQNISFIQIRPGNRQECAIIRQDNDSRQQFNLQYSTDYNIIPGSQSIETEGQVVFVGYGIQDKKLRHNDFKNIDIKGKILVRLYGYPGWRSPGSKNYKRFTVDELSTQRLVEKDKDRVALAGGAMAIIEIRKGSTQFSAIPENLPFRYNSDTYEGDVPFSTEIPYRTLLQGTFAPSLTRIALSKSSLDLLMSGSEIDFNDYESRAAEKNIRPEEMPTDRYLKFISTVETRTIRGRNVIGMIEGKNPNSCMVIGAHYDHEGKTNGFIFNGSDDNASGTVGMMSVARAMMATGEKPDISLFFCAWTAEEKGLLGSKYYGEHPVIDDIKCYMNYDMISRTDPEDSTGMQCDYTYSSGLPCLKELTEQHIKDYGIRLNPAYHAAARPEGGSDFVTFSRKGIPIFLIHGKFTPDYHQFTDHAEKAVMPYMTEIVKLGYLNIYELAHRNW